MAPRRTVLFALLLPIVCPVNAHEYVCTVENTRPVAIASFRFTREDMLREHATHRDKPCPLPHYSVPRRVEQTARTGRISPVDQNSPLTATPGGGSGTGPAEMCGVVDDPYHDVAALAYRYCTTQAQSASTSTANRAVRPYRGIGFRVTRPSVYNAKDHHRVYGFDAGDVVGTCFVCVVVQKKAASSASDTIALPKE